MPISHLFGVVCDKCQEIKNVPNWDIFLFDYISDGIFMPIKSIVLANMSCVLMDKNSEDAKKWDEQKAKTAKSQKTGGILTATGVVGGAAGNLLINSDKDKEESESTDTEDGQSDTDKK